MIEQPPCLPDLAPNDFSFPKDERNDEKKTFYNHWRNKNQMLDNIFICEKDAMDFEKECQNVAFN